MVNALLLAIAIQLARTFILTTMYPITIHSTGSRTITGTGVTVSTVVRKFKMGASVAQLCTDFGLTTAQVEAAIRYQMSTPCQRRKQVALRDAQG